MGGQHHDPDHGRHLRPIPGGAGHRYDGDGGVFPLCRQRLHSGPVHGLGTAVSGRGLAVVPGFWRAAHRGGESPASFGPGRDFRHPDHLRQAHFQPAAEYCPRTLHRSDGYVHGTEQFYVCRYPAGTEQWTDHHRIGSHRCGPDSADYPDDRPGLELLQAPAGNGGAVCAGGRPLLYIAAGLRYGRVQGDLAGLPVLVPDGGLPVVATGS